MEWPTLGWLIGVLVSLAVPILLILLVLAIIRLERLRAQRNVRSSDYWEEQPDPRRYPTGWDQLPGAEGREPGGPEPPPDEGGGRPPPER